MERKNISAFISRIYVTQKTNMNTNTHKLKETIEIHNHKTYQKKAFSYYIVLIKFSWNFELMYTWGHEPYRSAQC